MIVVCKLAIALIMVLWASPPAVTQANVPIVQNNATPSPAATAVEGISNDSFYGQFVAKIESMIEESNLKFDQLIIKVNETLQKVNQLSSRCTWPWRLLKPELCIKIEEVNTAWIKAPKFCQWIGGKLLSFNDAEEVALVKNFIKISHEASEKSYTGGYWVGHHYINKRPVSVNSAYNPPKGLYWSKNNLGLGRCTIIWFDGEMVAHPCSYPQRIICRWYG